MRQASAVSESPRRELLSFRLGEQEFCLDIMAVREIRGWTEATPLPRAPDYIRGMINLRGTVFPVVDMSVRLGLPANDLASRKVIIVVWIDTKVVGYMRYRALDEDARRSARPSRHHGQPGASRSDAHGAH